MKLQLFSPAPTPAGILFRVAVQGPMNDTGDLRLPAAIQAGDNSPGGCKHNTHRQAHAELRPAATKFY